MGVKVRVIVQLVRLAKAALFRQVLFDGVKYWASGPDRVAEVSVTVTAPVFSKPAPCRAFVELPTSVASKVGVMRPTLLP